MIAALRERHRGDDGMTLVELLITMAVLLVLLGMVLLSMNLINSISSSVSAQYQEFDQVVPALAPIRSLIAAEVEPAPVTGHPTPAFQYVGNFGLIWHANIGTSHANIVGASANCAASICTGGPALVAAVEVDGSGAGVTSATQCDAQSPCRLQVWMYLPLITNGISSCPVPVNGSLPNGTCQYPPTNADGTPAPAASSSQYSGKVILVANILNVVNNPYSTTGVPAAGEALFTYVVNDPAAGASYQLTPTDLSITPSQSQQMITELPGGSEPLSTCTGASVANCPMDAIISVGIHIKVDKPGSGTNGYVENQVIDYRTPLSVQDSGGQCYPFQYSSQCDPYTS